MLEPHMYEEYIKVIIKYRWYICQKPN